MTCGVGAIVPASPPRPEPQIIPRLGLASLGYFVSFELMNDAVSLAAETIESGIKFVAARLLYPGHHVQMQLLPNLSSVMINTYTDRPLPRHTLQQVRLICD